MAKMLQKPVFALPGCRRMSVNTLLCDTLALADFLSVGSRERKRKKIFEIWIFFRKCGLLLWLVRAQHDHSESECERKSGGRYLPSHHKCECEQKSPDFIYNHFLADGRGSLARCVHPCVAKTCAVRQVFAHLAGELGQQIQEFAQNDYEANASSGRGDTLRRLDEAQEPGISSTRKQKTRTVSTC